jgi:hypothetical protein
VFILLGFGRNNQLGGLEFEFGAWFALFVAMLKDFHAFRLAKQYYQISKAVKLTYFLENQFLRASSSIALNIAEGSGKRTPRDQIKFYSS